MEQRSPEWFAARSGIPTASEFATILTKGRKGEPSKVRMKYAMELASERITGAPNTAFMSKPTTWGLEQEPLAKSAYELRFGCFIEEAGFIRHPSIATGCSPDMLVNPNGGGEVKCPYNSDIHLATILNGMPKEHKPQVQGTLWITGREWYDFVSFDSRQPPGLQLYVERQYRDEAFIIQLQLEVERFLDEVLEIENRLSALIEESVPAQQTEEVLETMEEL